MRFLHTADWHIGKTLFGRSRLDEQEQVIAEIVDIARLEHVDCVLLAGDVFESLAPTGDAERVVCDALAEFAGAGIATVVVGGNHDHSRRLAALRKLGNPLKIFIRPDPAPPADGGVISLQKGGEIAQIAVLPWVPEFKIVDICQMMNPEDTWYEAYSDNVAAMCRHLSTGFSEKTINILVGHLFAYGAETSGSERAVHVSQPYAVKPAQLPQAQYIALGHIHKPQEIGSSTRCFYSGSPLQLDFGEREQQKRVVMVDVKAGFPANIESIVLVSGRRLREVITTIDELPSVASEAGTDFLRVIVKADARISGLSQQVCEVLPNALEVRHEAPATSEPVSTDALVSQSPRELFERFVRERRNTNAPPEMLTRFEELYNEAKDAADQA
ncbi:MAG: exonuclease SbcCD subunit D [Bryobacteraceae bacterium]|jgi:exonuclease SbcD